MDSKKLELEQRLSALNGFTKTDGYVYRTLLAGMFTNAKLNVFIVKEFLRHYYKNTKVVMCKQGMVSMYGCKDYDRINYEINPDVKDIIDIVIDSVARKVYKRFVEKLDYFLATGKLKLTKYEDYLNDPDDFIVNNENDIPNGTDDTTGDIDWENRNEAFEYRYSGYANFTEHHIYDKSAYPINVYNKHADFNKDDNTEFIEKCKLYSDSLEKFKNNLVEEFKNNLLQFKYSSGFQLLFNDIVKKVLMESRSKRFVYKMRNNKDCDEAYEKLKAFIQEEYTECGLDFTVPYLTEINKDVIEKRKAIQAEIDALDAE